jgi:hypothetical protein
MSRQNKVNPGMYTQRGRLAQDDAAREIAKQRSIGSEYTWQPVKRDHRQVPASKDEDGDEDSAAEEQAPTAKKPARVLAKTKPAAQAKVKSKLRTQAKAKAPRSARKAVLARGAGKGSALLAAGRKKKKAATTAKKRAR